MIMAQSTLVRSASPLTDDQLRRAAPSIFTDTVSDSRSHRYSMVTTASVIAGMRDTGFFPVAVQQQATRDEGGSAYARHMVRFRHHSAMAVKKGDEYEEIILRNSHDGTSAFQLDLGMFRLVCMNGLVTSRAGGSVSVPHKGDAVGMVIEGATRILEDVQQIAMVKDEMKSIILAPAERIAFASAALQLRYAGAESAFTPESVLNVRRIGDFEPSLWNTYNAVQENMIKGGLRGVNANGRRTSSRAITSIGADMAINRMLWSLADAARNMKDTMGDAFALAAQGDVIEA
jgi:hypothetical protein